MRFFCLVLLLALGCGDDDRPARDGAVADTGGVDSGGGAEDAGAEDAGDTDAGSDSGADDAGADDAGTDAGADDAGADDAGADSAADSASDASMMACVEATITTEAVSSTTIDAEDNFDPVDGCVGGFATGDDVVFAFTAGDAGTYRITVMPSPEWNPMVYVLDDCSGETCSDGTNFGSIGDPETLDIELAAVETATIVVDTALTDIFGGAFTIEVAAR